MIDRVLSRLFPVSRKGFALVRYYVRRAGDRGRWGLFIHKLVKSDPEDAFHNHPWNGVALIFGSYLEETPTTPLRRRRLFNRVTADGYHRVEIERETWTIFLHFRRRGGWRFIDRSGNVLREFGSNPWRGPDA